MGRDGMVDVDQNNQFIFTIGKEGRSFEKSL